MNNPRNIFYVCLLSISLIAYAQAAKPTARDQARAAFKAGQQALAAEQYGKAIAGFQKAHQLAPHPAMLLNIARVYEAVEDLKNAIRFFKAYKKANPKAKDIGKKIAELRARYASWPSVNITSTPAGLDVWVTNQSHPIAGQTPLRLRMKGGDFAVWVGRENKTTKKVVTFAQGSTPTIAFTLSADTALTQGEAVNSKQRPNSNNSTLTVNVDAPGAEVRIDDRLVGIAPLPSALFLTPGLHNLTVTSPDGAVHKEVVNLAPQEKRQVLIALSENVGAYSSTEILAISSMGIGGASVIAAIATGMMALEANTKLKDCRANECAGSLDEVNFADDVRSKAKLTDILLGCGIALSSAGTYLWLQDKPSTPSSSAKINDPPRQQWDANTAWSPAK
jgi:tetratricopeptide (TPR) repeat protein